MINIADLIAESSLPGNYFAPNAYVQGDFESGLIENRQGNRLPRFARYSNERNL